MNPKKKRKKKEVPKAGSSESTRSVELEELREEVDELRKLVNMSKSPKTRVKKRRVSSNPRATATVKADVLCSEDFKNASFDASAAPLLLGVSQPVYELQDISSLAGLPRGLQPQPAKHFEQGPLGDLLDQVRLCWLAGDWQSIAALDVRRLVGHPDREKLSALVASALLQQRKNEQARSLAELARSWGCPHQFLSQTLAAGAARNLAQAHVLAGRSDKARGALATGFGDTGLTEHLAGILLASTARADNPASRPSAADSAADHARTTIPGLAHPEEPSAPRIPTRSAAERLDEQYATYMANHHIQEISARIQTEDHPRKKSLEAAANTLQHITGEKTAPQLDTTQFDVNSRRILLTHIHGDYIPHKIKSRATFYEDDFLETLGCLHCRDGIIIDVGANIGNHTVYFAAVLGADVIAIEPEPHNYFCLLLNAISNAGPGSVRCWNIACGQQDSRITLEMKLRNNYGSFTSSLAANLQPSNPCYGNIHETPLLRLDSVTDRKSVISILKIDVEGMELEVLQGASSLIARNLPIIAVECFTNTIFLEICTHLRNYGYFPVHVLNATPTFIFLSARNPRHLSALQGLLGRNAVKTACKNAAFIL